MATMSGGAHLGIPATSQGVGGRSQRRKDSSPSARFWESPDTLAQLEVVRQWVGKHYKKVGSRSRKLTSQQASRPLLVSVVALVVNKRLVSDSLVFSPGN